MLFGNVFSGITQVAKSVISMFNGEDESKAITHLEHELKTPTATLVEVEDLAVLTEKWLQVDVSELFEGRVTFSVSNFGNTQIKYLHAPTGEWRTSAAKRYLRCGNPHITVQARINGKSTSKNVNLSKLIMGLFGEPKPTYIAESTLGERLNCIEFKDGDAFNCHIENLYWISESEFKKKVEETSIALAKGQAANSERAKLRREERNKPFEIPSHWIAVDEKYCVFGRKIFLEVLDDSVALHVQKATKNGIKDEYKVATISGSLGGSSRYITISHSGDSKVINATKLVLITASKQEQPDYISDRHPAIHFEDGNQDNLHPSNLRWLTKDEVEERLIKRGGHNFKAKQVETSEESKRTSLVLADLDKPKEQDDWIIAPIEPIKVDKPIEVQVKEKAQPVYIDYHKAMREEVWVPIPKFEDTYEISSFGNVRSVDRFATRHRIKRVNGEDVKVAYSFPIKGRRLKPCMLEGELIVTLSRGGKQSVFTVARLVIAVFAKDKLRSSKFSVIHLNGNTNNCRLNNLRIAEEVVTAA